MIHKTNGMYNNIMLHILQNSYHILLSILSVENFLRKIKWKRKIYKIDENFMYEMNHKIRFFYSFPKQEL